MSEKQFVQVGANIINLQRVSWARISKSGKLTVKLADEENELILAGKDAFDLYTFLQICGFSLSQPKVEWEKPLMSDSALADAAASDPWRNIKGEL